MVEEDIRTYEKEDKRTASDIKKERNSKESFGDFSYRKYVAAN